MGTKSKWLGDWLLVVLLVVFAGGSVFGQEMTVLYKDFQQTVTVPHIYEMPSVGPPLTVQGPGLGYPATGFAADMVGGSPLASLGVATPAGKIRRLTDGGAAGAVVVSDGTKWDCGASQGMRVYIVTCPPWNAKGDGVTDDTGAILGAIGTGNRVVVIPAGTYMVLNIIYQSNTRIIGQGVGVTTLKQLPNSIGAVMGNTMTPVSNIEISHMTIDGNGATQVHPNQYGILNTNGATNLWFHHLEVKNSIVYCVALENGVIQGMMSDMAIGPCGWDGIDIKNPMNQTRLEISNIAVTGPGSTIGATPGAVAAVCLDSRGRNRMNNVRCLGLNNGGTGFGFQRHENGPSANCDVAYCDGGKGSTLSNFLVETVASPTGETTGVRPRDEGIQVSNGFIKGVARGIWLETTPVEGSDKNMVVSNVVIEGATIAGVVASATSSYASFNNMVITGAQTGAILAGVGSRINASKIENSVGDGVAVVATGDNARVSNTVVTNSGGIGVRIDTGAVNTVAVNNLIAGSGGAAMVDNGTTSYIQGNGGVATYKKGGTTIPAGSTSVTVTHGLSFPPSIVDIQVTAAGNPTNDPGLIWVEQSTMTTSSFEVRCRNAPGGSGLPLIWQARIKAGY